MARNTAAKTAAKTPARPARRRVPRATAQAAPSDKAVEAGIASAAERPQSAVHPSTLPHGPEAFGAAIGGFLNSLSGLQLPQPRLSELQEQYVNQATSLWNGAVDQIPVGGDDKPAAPKPIGDRRFAAEDWLKNPAAAFTAQLYLLNARTMTQLADSLQGDEKTKARVTKRWKEFGLE